MTVSKHPCCFADRSRIPRCLQRYKFDAVAISRMCESWLVKIKGSKGHAFHACMKKAWLILTRKHRKVAFFRRKWTNLRCFRIARAWNAKQSVYHRNQNIFWPQHHLITLTKSSCKATIRLWDILRSDPVTDVFPMLLQVAGIIKTDIVHHPYCFFLLWWLQQDLCFYHTLKYKKRKFFWL